jgi:MFS family permease
MSSASKSGDQQYFRRKGSPFTVAHQASTAGRDTISALLALVLHAGRRVAAALTYRDFRLLWSGALVSSIGTWMQKVAQAWLIVTLTASGSAFYLGLDSFLGEAPILLFTLIGGVVADRANRRHLLLASQCVQMAAAFTLAALVFTDNIRIWQILTLSFITGVAQAFGGPAYQSLIPSLIPKDTLPNAIALNSIQFNLARVIGPWVAGAALTAFGMVACFGLNGVSFLFVMAAILALHVTHVRPAGVEGMRAQLKGGLHYVRHHPQLVTLTLLGFISAFLGFPLLTFLPVITKDVFNQGVGLYTNFMTLAGIGAVLGALSVAWLGKHRHMGWALLTMLAVLGVIVVAFSLSTTLWLSRLLLFLGGALLVTCLSMTTSLVQLLAPHELRGRVVSIYMVAFRGGSPLGGLVSGLLVTQIGSAPYVLALNGALLTVIALIAMTRDHGLREI